MPKWPGVFQVLVAVLFLMQAPLHLQHTLMGSLPLASVMPGMPEMPGMPAGHAHPSHPAAGGHAALDAQLALCCMPLVPVAPTVQGLVRPAEPQEGHEKEGRTVARRQAVQASARDPPIPGTFLTV